MRRFDAALAALIGETGWKPSEPDPSGQVTFSLADLTFSLSSPDDRHLYFRYRLATPEENEVATQARGYAHMAAASARRRQSTLSWHAGAFYLHHEVDLTASGAGQIPLFCQQFLNDCDWWRQNAPPLT
jgi:acetyl esterase/lipase